MHTIRLREPWESEAFPERQVFRRSFNRPSGLTPGEVVRLAVDELTPGATVSFNAVLLPENAAAWDITPYLESRNTIAIEVPGSGSPEDRPFREVRLVIG